MTDSKKPISNRKDVLLLLLYSPGKSDQVNESITGRTRLVKMLFLFKKEVLPHFQRGTDLTEENFFNFFAWDFGPFSSDVYDDLTFFVLRGFVTTSAAQEETLPESAAEWEYWLRDSGSDQSQGDAGDYEEEEITLTESGEAFSRSLYDTLNQTQRNLLKEFKARLVSAPLRAILKYVYTKYPDTTAKSKIKGDVLGHAV